MKPSAGSLVKVLFAAVLVGALVFALVDQGDVVRRDLASLSTGTVLGAFSALLVGLLLSMLSWRAVLAELGSPLPVPVASRIFFVGQIGKYLPGSVWPLLTQAQMGTSAGVPRSRMLTGGLVSLGLSTATGLLTGLLVAGTLLSQQGRAYLVGLGLVLPVALAGLHPAVLNRLLATGLRLMRRPALERELSARGIARAASLLLGCWCAFGVQAWLLADALGAGGVRALPLAIGAFALASTLGLLFVVAPAGAGVREAVLVLGLAPVLSPGSATAVALVSRFLATVADATVAGAAVVAARRAGVLERRGAAAETRSG